MENIEIIRIFAECDDFEKQFAPLWQATLLGTGKPRRHRDRTLCLSEVLTIIVLFQGSGYRNFKTFYTEHVCKLLRWAFPHTVSYQRFVELQGDALVPLTVFLHTRLGACSGVSFIDSTKVAVCHPLRIKANRVFKDVARLGKTSTGWFYGFKVHLVVSECGELLAVKFTLGNCDDRKYVPQLTAKLWGKLIGDRGYISQPLFTLLYERGLQLITKIRKNMKNKLLPLADKLLLRKRAIIETINDQLKNICQLEHTRHRSIVNFCVNLVAALVAYTFREKKPSLRIDPELLKALPPAALA